MGNKKEQQKEKRSVLAKEIKPDECGYIFHFNHMDGTLVMGEELPPGPLNLKALQAKYNANNKYYWKGEYGEYLLIIKKKAIAKLKVAELSHHALNDFLSRHAQRQSYQLNGRPHTHWALVDFEVV